MHVDQQAAPQGSDSDCRRTGIDRAARKQCEPDARVPVDPWLGRSSQRTVELNRLDQAAAAGGQLRERVVPAARIRDRDRLSQAGAEITFDASLIHYSHPGMTRVDATSTSSTRSRA